MVYGSYARGYKPGGFNPGITAINGADASLTFDREDVNAFEIGAKGLLFNGTLSIGAAAFFNDYLDLQLARPRIDALNLGSGNTNVDAQMFGLELEARWRPAAAPRAEFELGYAWLTAELKGRRSWVNTASRTPTLPKSCRSAA